ncbi:MAG: hypothetical protein LW834_06850 [Cyanobium sp. 49614_E6]|nr:hypothetical protein [Cyanobium sp. 49614_E6]MCE2836664.1 hypothetical protein [Cyanobium sp. 49614_E6]
MAPQPWMIPQLSVDAESDLRRMRELLQTMSRDELLGQADILLNQVVNKAAVISQAIRHISELEAREAVRDPEPGPMPQGWTAGVLGGLG